MTDVAKSISVKDISDYMHYLGAPSNLKGHDNLIDSLYKAYYRPELLNNLTKGLYKEIAETYQTNVTCVERNIRTVIDAIWLNGDAEVLYPIFGNTISNKRGKPTNKQFLTMIVFTLK